ncbi:MAG: alpha/beta hydrolase [Castellaniella sp.]|uniref:alpha/beta hydrolase n=1 Tax=Castellaniella sp. TaxID=1955812 RepID=UPI003A8959EE
MISPAFDLPLEDGRTCTVRVAAPPGCMPAHGWPVAYVLDLKQFESMRADPRGLPGLLVGLGPGVPEDRRWDYTPLGAGRRVGRSDETRGAASAAPPGLRVGAARWLRVLDRVRAQVARDWRLDSRHQVLCGHSLGALFALYVLTHRARAFEGYVLSSPSVWWGDHYAIRLLRRRRAWLCARQMPSLGVRLTVGAHEQGLAPEEYGCAIPAEERARRLALRRARAMVDGMHELAGTLARCPGLRLDSAVLPGHTHQSAPVEALMSGWRWLLAGASGEETPAAGTDPAGHGRR